MTIAGETPRALHAMQEVTVLRATVRAGTAPPALRQRLAVLLNQLDAFGETIDLLAQIPAEARTYHEQMLLAAAYLSRRDVDDRERALAASEAALTLADSDAQAATALAEQAKALVKTDRAAAHSLLREALARDPGNQAACDRLTLDLLLADEAQAALDVTDALIAQGIGHAHLLAARASALARLGDFEASRDLLSLDRFLWQGSIEPPDGWPSLDSFNHALADELLASSSLRYGRHGTASVESWRIDSLVAGDAPLARLLVGQIVAAVQRRFEQLGGIDHPWIATMPRNAVVRSWCVITERSGHEAWHMHPYGWMSGVYYVAVPDAVRDGSDAKGCLMVGLSDTLAGEAAAQSVGYALVRPHAGLLATFPSHAYHRTFAHHAPGKRICVAFDVAAA